MCGVTLKNKVTSDELLSRMNLRSVFEVVRHNRFGHVIGLDMIGLDM